MEENLETLVLQAQNGDKKALEEICNRFRLFISKTCKNFYIKDYDMDDLIQIGYISLMKAIKGYVPTDKPHFITYATSAIKNNFYLEIRKKSRYGSETSLNVPSEGGDELLYFLQAEGEIDDALIKEENKKLLLEAIATLSIEQREMIFYLFFMKMTMVQYADWCGLKYVTCAKRKTNILKILRGKLNEHFYNGSK